MSLDEDFLRKFTKSRLSPDEQLAVESAARRKENMQDQKIDRSDTAALIGNYIRRFTEVLNRTDPDARQRGIEQLKAILHDQFIIKLETIPESYFESIKQKHREEGHGEIDISDDLKVELSQTIIDDQIRSLDEWIDYLASEDAKYPDALKYFVFRNVVTIGKYDKEKDKFTKRSKGSVSPFPDLNRGALAFVCDAMEKKYKGEPVSFPHDITNDEKNAFNDALQKEQFPKLYAWAINSINPVPKELMQTTEGVWFTFPKGSDPMTYIPSTTVNGEITVGQPLVPSIESYATGWCLRGEATARRYLETSELQIFYSLDEKGQPSIPRVVTVQNNKGLAEVRGIAEKEHLDLYITPVVEEKLKEFPDGEAYKKKTSDMKCLTEIDRKNIAGEDLTKDDIRFLYEIDSTIEGFGYQKDPRISEILAGRDIKEDISFATGFSKEQISITTEEGIKGGIKYHYGDLDLRSLTSAEGLTLPKTINGYLDLRSLTSAEGLTLPEAINGDLYLSSLTSAEGLTLPEAINGDLYLSSLTSAEELQLPKTINGYLDLRNLTFAEELQFPETIEGYLDLRSFTSAEGLTLPETIEGYLDLRSFTSAEGLTLPKTIEGYLDLRSFTSAEGLTLPKTIEGYLNLSSLTSAEGLTLPKTINGYLDLKSLTSAEGLTLPKTINGYLDLKSLTSAEGLTLPETINGDLDLSSLTSAEGLTFPETLSGYYSLSGLTSAEGLTFPEALSGYLDLRSITSAEGLQLPETITGSLDLNGLTSAEGLQLPTTINGNGNLFLRSLTSAEGLQLPKILKGTLNLSSLTSAEGLTLPKTINGYLDLKSLTSAEGLTLPETINGDLDLNGLTSAEGLKLPKTIKRNLDLSGLTSAEGLQLPTTISGNLNLSGLTSADKSELQKRYPNLKIIVN